MDTVRVRDIMTTDVVTVRDDANLVDVARTMLDRGVGCLPVVDEAGLLVGIVTQGDFTGKRRGFPFSAVRAPQLFGEWVDAEGVERIYAGARERRVREIMTEEVVTVTEDDSLTDVVVVMVERDVDRLPVVRDGAVVGIVTGRDLLRVLVERVGDAGSGSSPR
jgi:CBS domain-containing protein